MSSNFNQTQGGICFILFDVYWKFHFSPQATTTCDYYIGSIFWSFWYWAGVISNFIVFGLCFTAFLEHVADLRALQRLSLKTIFSFTHLDSQREQTDFFCLLVKILLTALSLFLFTQDIFINLWDLYGWCEYDPFSLGLIWGWCEWVNSGLVLLFEYMQISLMLLYTLYWLWQYKLTFSNPRPFYSMLYEWLIYTGLIFLPGMIDFILVPFFQHCPFLLWFPPYWNLIIRTSLILTFIIASGFLLYQVRKTGNSTLAVRFMNQMFYQTLVVAALCLLSLSLEIYESSFVFSLTCQFSFFSQLFYPLFYPLPMLITLYSVSRSNSFLFLPCYKCDPALLKEDDEDPQDRNTELDRFTKDSTPLVADLQDHSSYGSLTVSS